MGNCGVYAAVRTIRLYQFGIPVLHITGSEQTMRLALLTCFFVMVGLANIAAATDPPKGEDKEDKLDPEQYRVKVESIFEPPGDLAIYRVRVWTVGKQQVELSLSDDPAFSVRCASEPDAEGKLHRADFVIFVTLRGLRDRAPNGNSVDLEQRFLLGGVSGGGNTATRQVPKETKLENVVGITVGTNTRKRGDNLALGKLDGKMVEVTVEKAK
jgi:hypothetical protein